jgi:hypothetical protein
LLCSKVICLFLSFFIVQHITGCIVLKKNFWLIQAECSQNSRKNFSFIQNGIMFFNFRCIYIYTFSHIHDQALPWPWWLGTPTNSQAVTVSWRAVGSKFNNVGCISVTKEWKFQTVLQQTKFSFTELLSWL